jgi:hypothetical protein
MAARAWSLQRVEVAAVLSVVLLLAGCAATQKGVGGWFAAATPTPTPTPALSPTPRMKAVQARRVYYVRVGGLKMYSDPSASSKVVGTLSLHEKVMRSRVERGFAFVESTKSGVKGWVDNAQLSWRLPTATPGPAGAQPEEAQPEPVPPEEPVAPTGEEPQASPAPEATAPAAEPEPVATPMPTASPSALPTPRPLGPSIFNPY